MKFDYSPSHFFTSTEINIRFRDLDPLNHVNNAVYNSYFEEARIRFIKEIPEFDKSIGTGKSFILVNINIDYIKPVVYGDTIIVCSSVKSFGNSSIKGIQAIFDQRTEKLKAVAQSTGVWFNLKDQKPARLPEIKDKEKYLFKG